MNPIVPDATENSSVSTLSNLSLLQFRNTIKYYYITQTGTDTNFDIDAQTWNANLNKNIRKWLYVQGTIGSNSTTSPAAEFNSTAYNLTIDVSGNIYGAGGSSGTSATISGGNAGNALSITNTSGSNLVVNLQSTGKIYGGGGGGEKGVDGVDGSGGTCVTEDIRQYCAGSPDSSCNAGVYQYTRRPGCCRSTMRGGCVESVYQNVCSVYTYTSGGSRGIGGNGGVGQGYNQTRTNGAQRTLGTGGGGCGATNGTDGETGGNGGDWASPGGNTTNSGNGGSAGRAITGSNYSVTGTINSSTIKGLYQ